jgi:protoporphyrinogen oxidase
MMASWVGERVAPVDLKKVLSGVALGKDATSWGPNSTFRFPAHGGTGAIWEGVAASLPAAQLRTGNYVSAVDSASRTLTLWPSGEQLRYSALISTAPLDVLLGRLLTDQPSQRPLAPHFLHSSTHVVGVGLAGEPPEQLRGKCWMYFAEPSDDPTPFYRVTLFSHYGPGNVPGPGFWSLMCEVAESPERPPPGDGSKEAVVADVLRGLRAAGMVREEDTVVSTWHRRLEYGYPTPWLGRDEAVHAADAALRPLGIFSRGRFGAWKYEVSNQDHSFAQGVEAVDAIVSQPPGSADAGGAAADEPTFRTPDAVNAGKAPPRPLPAVAPGWA